MFKFFPFAMHVSGVELRLGSRKGMSWLRIDRESPISDPSEALFSVSDIKHYIYCPKIVYFEKVLHAQPLFGSQQEESRKMHEKIEEKELRRGSIIPYTKEFEHAEKFFRVQLVSKKLKLQGTIDCLVKVAQEYIPIDYKNTESNRGRAWRDHKYQLVAYALLIDENYCTVVRRGYISYLPERLTLKVEITPEMKKHVKRILTQIERIVSQGNPPKIRPHKKRCSGGCGYRWMCLL